MNEKEKKTEGKNKDDKKTKVPVLGLILSEELFYLWWPLSL